MVIQHESTMRRSGAALLLAAWVVGAALRVWNLPAQVLSDDEMHTVRAVITKPATELLSSFGRLDYSVPMAAFYRLLSDSGLELTEGILRLVPLAAGFVLLVVLPLAVKPLLGRRTAVWLAWLLAVSFPLVHYSRVVRPYSWSTLLGVVAVAAFARWWAGGRWGWGALYAASAALAIWFLPVVAPFVGAPLLWAAGKIVAQRRWRDGVRLVGIGAALAVGLAIVLLPALPSLLEVVQRKSGRPAPPVDSWLGALQIHGGSSNPGVVTGMWLVALAGFIILLRRRRTLALYWALPVALQVVVVRFVSPLGASQPHVLERYLLPTLPVLLAWVACALATPARKRSWGWVRDILAAAVVGAVLLTGPFGDRDFRASPFMHHKDYLNLHEPRARVAPEDVPPFYPWVLRDLAPGPLLEYPWLPVWHYTQALRVYQEIHGREVVVASPADQDWDRRLEFRNMTSGSAEGFLASRARFLVLHLDYGAEEARVVESFRRSPGIRRPGRQGLRRLMQAQAEALQDQWGPPDFSDPHLRVWDLERIRRVNDGGILGSERDRQSR
jgi:hypothetical protein